MYYGRTIWAYVDGSYWVLQVQYKIGMLTEIVTELDSCPENYYL